MADGCWRCFLGERQSARAREHRRCKQPPAKPAPGMQGMPMDQGMMGHMTGGGMMGRGMMVQKMGEIAAKYASRRTAPGAERCMERA